MPCRFSNTTKSPITSVPFYTFHSSLFAKTLRKTLWLSDCPMTDYIFIFTTLPMRYDSHSFLIIWFLYVPKRAYHTIPQDANYYLYRYKHTLSEQIFPLCKDDLVCLLRKISTALGGIGPIVLVSKVSTSVIMLDPFTLQTADLSAQLYLNTLFRPMMSIKKACNSFFLM